MVIQRWLKVGPTSTTFKQRWFNAGSPLSPFWQYCDRWKSEVKAMPYSYRHRCNIVTEGNLKLWQFPTLIDIVTIPRQEEI